MTQPFETWARVEIERLRAEATTLQHALDKYLESQGIQPVTATHLNGATLPVRKPKLASAAARKGSKRSLVLAKIAESIGGATTGELFDAAHRAFPDMKRSSLRAMLYHEKKSGNIDQHKNGRYVLKDRPSAPTLDLSE